MIGEPSPWTCPLCDRPLRVVVDPRAADRYLCTARGCGRVFVVVEWTADGKPVLL